MRLLFVVQGYGAGVAGGAETACRAFATRLAARGHTVEVLSAADSPDTSAATEDGVVVRRLGRAHPLDAATFGPFTERAIYGHPPPALITQELWLRAQGPALPDLEPWLAGAAGTFDVAVFFTYLFRTFWSGMATAAGRVPVVAHATAHDEPYFFLPAFDTALRRPDAYAWFTEEERDLLRRRGDGHRPGMVIGIGVEMDRPADPARFRLAVPALGDRPYLLCLGRITAGKGVVELSEWFAAYKQRRPGPLALVFVGAADVELPAHPDVFVTGFVPDQLRTDALSGALALVQPSAMESFSMVLSEAWAQGRPGLVLGRSQVLAGQVRRSGGGASYRHYAEWAAAVDVLVDHPETADVWGSAGRRYAQEQYSWDAVLARYERLLSLAISLHHERRAPRGGLRSRERTGPGGPR